ncbi:Orexin receptor type 2 [Varanus komodoensis]|nr:Orexin receptor type 2 [Varanus komodoensis]
MSVTQAEGGSPSCLNGSSNTELNGTQEPFGNPSADYDEEEFLQFLWREYLHPKEYEWVLIAGYIVVFLVALIGNILVWKNHHMRTVTNYFIVNLSLADILVTITCLPATLVVDITETWFFGDSLCKVFPYLQTVSVSVSVLTLSCIALDRWYAICHPLMFKSTAKRARNSIIMIWIASCIVMIPQAIVMECSSVFPGLANKTVLFTVCDEHWEAVLCSGRVGGRLSANNICRENNRIGRTRDLFKKIGDMKGKFHAKMGMIKDQNGRDLTEAEEIKKRWQDYTEELYKKELNVPDNLNGVVTDLEPDILECDVKWALGGLSNNKASGGDTDVYPKMYHSCFFLITYMAPLCLMVLAYLQIFQKLWCRQIPGTTSVVQRKWKPLQFAAQARELRPAANLRISAVAAEIKQIRIRRKTARMLMVVLLVFAICYLPISILNLLKRVFGMFNNADDRETVYAWFTFSHWLVYANSAANPIIYNFLSGKFREEFKAAFSCCCFGIRHHHDERHRGRTSTESRKSLATQLSNCDHVTKLSEHVALSNISTLPANGTGSIHIW